MYYDVVVAGGSVAGLLCAREIAGSHSVLVLEENYEIGTPEHCGGLVSMSGLDDLGIIPFGKIMGHQIESATIFAPDGHSFSIDSKKQKILEIDRRELDKRIAYHAQRLGAVIRVNTSFQAITERGVRTNAGEIACKIFVDARGISSLVQSDRAGILSSAQYEVYADWIEKGSISVYLDQNRFPGFFAWVIPTGNGRGKAGAAGRGINAAVALDDFLAERGTHSIIRKIYAPIWINGPIARFVNGKTVIVGDAAGQAKPTTAGGIYSSGMGGLLAGRAISEFLSTGNRSDLEEYQRAWTCKFGREFEKQLLARSILERVDNSTINKLFESITEKTVLEISNGDGFDFHARSIARLLGAKETLKIIRAVAGADLKRLLHLLRL